MMGVLVPFKQFGCYNNGEVLMCAKCSLPLVFGLALAANAVFAAVSWQTGSYTPGDWEPADNNILAGLVAEDGLSHYVEGGKAMTQDVAALTDGVVPTSGDYTKVVGVSGGTLTWALPQEYSLLQLRVFTWWGDGGRDGIHISEIAVKHGGSSEWTVLDVPAVNYGCGNNGTAGSLFAFLADDAGDPLAVNVTDLRITFGQPQDNNGTGYVEIEAVALGVERLHVTLKRKYAAPHKAALEASVLTCGEGASSVDYYFGCGLESEDGTLPAATCYTNGLVAGDVFDILLSGLQPGTNYVCVYHAVNDLGEETIPRTLSFATADGSASAWLGLVSEDWSEPMNWDSEIAPSGHVPKLILQTPYGSYHPRNLDIVGLAVDELHFSAGCTDDFTITGNPVTLKHLTAESSVTRTVTIRNEVSFAGCGEFSLGDAPIVIRFEGVVHSDPEAETALFSRSGGHVFLCHPANDITGRIEFHSGVLHFHADGNLGPPPAAPTPGYLQENWGGIHMEKPAGKNLNVITIHPNRGLSGDGFFINAGVELHYDGVTPPLQFNSPRHSATFIRLGGAAADTPGTLANLNGGLLIADSDTAFGGQHRTLYSYHASFDFNGHSAGANMQVYCEDAAAPGFFNNDPEREAGIAGDIWMDYSFGAPFFGGLGDMRHTGNFGYLRTDSPFRKHGRDTLALAGETYDWPGGTEYLGGGVVFDYRTFNTPRFIGHGWTVCGDCHLTFLGNEEEATDVDLGTISLRDGLSVLETRPGAAGIVAVLDRLADININRAIDLRIGEGTSLAVTNAAFVNDAVFGGIGPNVTWDFGRNWACITPERCFGPLPEDPAFFASAPTAGHIWDVPSGTSSVDAGATVNGIRFAAPGGPATVTLNQDVVLAEVGPESAGAILVSPDVGGKVSISGAGTIRPSGGNGIVIHNYATNHEAQISAKLVAYADYVNIRMYGPGTTVLDNDENSFPNGPGCYGGTVRFTSMADQGEPSALGLGSGVWYEPTGRIDAGDGTTFEYVGTTKEGHSSNRPFCLHGIVTLKANGAGPLRLTRETAIVSGYHSTRLVLDGAGVGIIEGAISPGKFGSVHKRGTGTWTLLSAGSAYHYPTVVEEGKLVASGSLPSSVEVRQGATLETSGLAIKRHLASNGKLRCIVDNPSPGEAAPIHVWGTVTLGGTLEICGKALADFVVLTAENGVTGKFDDVTSRFRVKYRENEVIACPIHATMLFLR